MQFSRLTNSSLVIVLLLFGGNEAWLGVVRGTDRFFADTLMSNGRKSPVERDRGRRIAIILTKFKGCFSEVNPYASFLAV